MATATNTTASPRLTVERVLSVYSGQDGKCCCGCSGKHYYASVHVEAASKRRGYAVTPDEVSDQMVRKVVKIINAQSAELVDVDASFLSTVIGRRLYIAYVD